MARREAWFGPKRIGAGWGPRTWQGWLIMALFTAVIIGITVFISLRSMS